jgi:NAD(P)-dependent dehydrogenase (short-subunit alcohol dehydrogenase family)
MMNDMAQAPGDAVVWHGDTRVGAAVMARLSADGWRVFGVSRPGTASGCLTCVPADRAQWHAVAEQLRHWGSAPRLLVHVIDASDATTTGAADDWHAAIDGSVHAAVAATQAIMPMMADGGAIVLTASSLAISDTQVAAAALTVGSAGLVAFARVLALAAAARQMTVNCVVYDVAQIELDARTSAAAVARIPLGQPATAADIAEAVAFYASADATYLTGSTLVIDGGQSLQSWSNAPE